jgi:hypothetical protein
MINGCNKQQISAYSIKYTSEGFGHRRQKTKPGGDTTHSIVCRRKVWRFGRNNGIKNPELGQGRQDTRVF